MTKTRDSFIFYRSFFNAAKHLKNDEKAALFDAICEFALDNKRENLSGVCAGMFELIKPQLEANRKRFENGCKGKRKSKTEAKRKQNGSKKKQTISKDEANVNDNVNLNLNENDNLECELESKNNNLYQDIVQGLKEIIETKLNKNLTTRGWHDEIRKLIEIDLKNRQDAKRDVIKAIQAVEDNHGEQYFPIIQSAKSLREKFDKIESYLARQRGSPSGLSVKDIMDLDLQS